MLYIITAILFKVALSTKDSNQVVSSLFVHRLQTCHISIYVPQTNEPNEVTSKNASSLVILDILFYIIYIFFLQFGNSS